MNLFSQYDLKVDIENVFIVGSPVQCTVHTYVEEEEFKQQQGRGMKHQERRG